MKVLIAPMAAIAETSGPFSRAKALAKGLLQNGHVPAFCAAKEINYQQVEGVQEYVAPIPSPMGLPMNIGKRVFGVAQHLGLQQRRRVHSFEEVLFIVGAIQERFFTEDVTAIQKAIRAFRPDVVYAEFRPAAIVAAHMEQTPVATGYSYPARKAYASSPQFSGGVKRFLKLHGMKEIESVLDIFEWADLKIVPSCYELEPIDDPNVVFTGPFSNSMIHEQVPGAGKNAIVAYMGNGSIAYPMLRSVLTRAFQGTSYQVHIASYQAELADEGNIHTAKRFDFETLLPQAAAFIHHGGQNSIISGIMSGAPQLIFPGNVFERQYNAASIEKLGLGKSYPDNQFHPEGILQAMEDFKRQTDFAEKVRSIQAQLVKLGGVDRAIQSLAQLVETREMVSG